MSRVVRVVIVIIIRVITDYPLVGIGIHDLISGSIYHSRVVVLGHVIVIVVDIVDIVMRR